jgi:hypothetical protein
LALPFIENFFCLAKSELKNSEAIIYRKGTTLKNIGKNLLIEKILIEPLYLKICQTLSQ